MSNKTNVLNLSEAIKNFNKGKESKVDQLDQQTIASKLYPGMTKTGREQRLSKIKNGHITLISVSEINNMCKILECEPNLLFNHSIF